MDHDLSYSYSRVNQKKKQKQYQHQHQQQQYYNNRTVRSVGFQVNPQSRRFSVYWLRPNRVLYFIKRILKSISRRWNNWKPYSSSSSNYGQAQALSTSSFKICGQSRCGTSTSTISSQIRRRRRRRRILSSVIWNIHGRSNTTSSAQFDDSNYNHLRYSSYDNRSNSFSAEAISDCLEFIRSSNR